MTTDISPSDDKDLTNPILKRPYRVADKTVIVIAEPLVKALRIDNNQTWFEQALTDDGILLKIMRIPNEGE